MLKLRTEQSAAQALGPVAKIAQQNVEKAQASTSGKKPAKKSVKKPETTQVKETVTPMQTETTVQPAQQSAPSERMEVDRSVEPSADIGDLLAAAMAQTDTGLGPHSVVDLSLAESKSDHLWETMAKFQLSSDPPEVKQEKEETPSGTGEAERPSSRLSSTSSKDAGAEVKIYQGHCRLLKAAARNVAGRVSQRAKKRKEGPISLPRSL